MARSIEEMELLQITLTDTRQQALMKISPTPPRATNPVLQGIVNSAQDALNTLLSDYCRVLDTSIAVLNQALDLIGEDRDGISETALATLDKMETIAVPIRTEFQNIRTQIKSLESRLIGLIQLQCSVHM